MSSESVECPLCMEAMDFDDVDFYPCPCRYQICRFCWYKIINEENGLCPACRKPYNSEHPASYKPRTEEEIKNKLKSSKKVCPKKGKQPQEGKEYLSEYRVLQKNLIFVVGLPMRMADEVELLKGTDYFGKCGKVYKIVINQNQTFPGPQGTSCLSAYVTYHRNEDALKTLVDLKKLEIDGRAVKLSLGTTKYCSQFLRNRKCTKQDCMYLHEMGDQAASFTKEDMANGKHTEYENQLIQEYHEILKLIIVNVCSTQTSTTTTTVTGTDCVVAPSQRKTSVTTSNNTTSSTMAVSSVLPTTTTITAGANNTKTHRLSGLNQMTPIGTDPNDASKVYMGSGGGGGGEMNNSKLTTTTNNINKQLSTTGTDQFLLTSLSSPSPLSTSPGNGTGISHKDHCYSPRDIKDLSCQSSLSVTNDSCLSNSLNSTSPLSSRVSEPPLFMNNPTDSTSSLLESFYQLNSQNHNNTANTCGSGASVVLGGGTGPTVINQHLHQQHHHQHLQQHQQHQQQQKHNQYEHHNINQQVNNNGLLSSYAHHYPTFRNNNDIDFTNHRLYASEKIGCSYDQKFKDNADIDFDPINISRKALEEMVAIENRQKMVAPSVISNYLNSKLMGGTGDSLYGGPSGGGISQQRTLLRPNPHDFMMQSVPSNSIGGGAGTGSGGGTAGSGGSGVDYFSMNSRTVGAGGASQPSRQSFIHDKPSPVETRLGQQINNLNLMGGAGGGSICCNSNNLISSTSSAVQSISSGYPSPPPGFEPTSNSNCLGDSASNDIMTLLLNQGNVDIYQRYQNQHSSPDLQMGGISHNQYNNQFQINYNCQTQISAPSNYHSEFNYSNGGGGGGSLMFNDINSQSLHASHSWKNAQSAFIDCTSDLSHAGMRSSSYNRSHSMNENSATAGIRNSEWNGFSSYTSQTDSSSHLSK